MKATNPAFEKKKQEVVEGAAKLPPQMIEDEDDEIVVKRKETKHEIDAYDCMVHIGADGLTQVPKRGIPAAELIMLQYLHGSEYVKKVKPARKKAVVQTEDIQFYLRDYLGANYGDKRVEYLWGNGLTGKSLPLTILDTTRTGMIADQQRAGTPDEDSFLTGKRIA
jgi:hypothetical protein